MKYFMLEISTHTSLAGRDRRKPKSYKVNIISTHTSLAGRDGKNMALGMGVGFDFYSHVPRGT